MTETCPTTARKSPAFRADRKERREAEKASKADRRREAAARRQALEPLAKEIRATEGLMDRLRKRLDTIEDQLADPKLYEKDPTSATQLAKERTQLTAQLTGHEERWLTMSAEYEEGVGGVGWSCSPASAPAGAAFWPYTGIRIHGKAAV